MALNGSSLSGGSESIGMAVRAIVACTLEPILDSLKSIIECVKKIFERSVTEVPPNAVPIQAGLQQPSPFIVEQFDRKAVNTYILKSGEKVEIKLDHDRDKPAIQIKRNGNGPFVFAGRLDYQGMMDQIQTMDGNKYSHYCPVSV